MQVCHTKASCLAQADECLLRSGDAITKRDGWIVSMRFMKKQSIREYCSARGFEMM